MLVSVAVPARDEEESLRVLLPALGEVLERRYGAGGYEVVVVDDISQDSTAEVVREVARRHDGIRLVPRTSDPGFGAEVRVAAPTFAVHFAGIFGTALGVHGRGDLRVLPLNPSTVEAAAQGVRIVYAVVPDQEAALGELDPQVRPVREAHFVVVKETVRPRGTMRVWVSGSTAGTGEGG